MKKYKYITCIALILIILIMKIGCSPSPPEFPDEPVNERGNTTGNITNGGHVAKEDGFIT